MASLAAWLFAIIAPVGKQLLVGLGFGVVTYAGVDVAFSSMVSSLTAELTQVPPDILVYAQLSGVFDAMGLILAAISFRISYMSMSRLVKL